MHTIVIQIVDGASTDQRCRLIDFQKDHCMAITIKEVNVVFVFSIMCTSFRSSQIVLILFVHFMCGSGSIVRSTPTLNTVVCSGVLECI